MPPPTRKEEWIDLFINELVLRLRPDIGLKFASLVANREWARQQGIAPEKAAQDWARGKSAR
jgi:hypothetical protein